jgi:hypothetical protein
VNLNGRDNVGSKLREKTESLFFRERKFCPYDKVTKDTRFVFYDKSGCKLTKDTRFVKDT